MCSICMCKIIQRTFWVICCLFEVMPLFSKEDILPYLNPDLPITQRIDDLVSRMTLEEKVSQMTHTSPGIPRLGIPDYNWWNECLHGVARSTEKVTVFPQPIGLAATFNPDELFKAAEMISDEGRAVYNESVKKEIR